MILPSGAIAPSSLFSHDDLSHMNAFNKTYANVPLRVGIITEVITADSEFSVSKKYPEYHVTVYEQNTNSGGTPTLYKNCPAANGFGSVADFFEYSLRAQDDIKNKANGIDALNQNGALVLLLCINGYGDRGTIISFLNHPNRPTTLVGDQTSLQGEFNGVNVAVADDGSCVLTFKGATDNWGNIIDTSQGTTTVSVEKDGSVQIQNDGVTQRLEKGGNVSITNKGDLAITTDGNIALSGHKGGVTLTSNSDNLTVATKGDLTFKVEGDININGENNTIKFNSSYSLKAQQIALEAEAMASIKAPQVTLDGICMLGGAGGLPFPVLTSQFIGANAAGPVVSVCVGPFTTKTFAV